MFQQLQPQLEKYLPDARHVYIATALIKNYGYQFIEKHLPSTAKRYYLIGLNLPSDASVFEQMLKTPVSRGHTRIFSAGQTFHPKVYLIELISGGWIAFIGSANTTNGGLYANVEMSVATQDEVTCKDLFEWFSKLSASASGLTQEFVDAWKRTTSKIRQRQAENSDDVTDIRALLQKPALSVRPVILRSGQFFLARHFEAYEEQYWQDQSPAAIRQRRDVWFRLAELDKRIIGQFDDYALSELASHYRKQNRISLYQYKQGFNNPVQKSLWLHYGYPETKKQKDFMEHPRMQVIVHHDDVGIWLVVGTVNSSVGERRRFKENLRNNPSFADLVFSIVADLGKHFWLGMNGEQASSLEQFRSPDQLAEALMSEDPGEYLIFGRTYSPDSNDLSDVSIAETVLVGFKRLYPLYQLYKNGRLS